MLSDGHREPRLSGHGAAVDVCWGCGSVLPAGWSCAVCVGGKAQVAGVVWAANLWAAHLQWEVWQVESMRERVFCV